MKLMIEPIICPIPEVAQSVTIPSAVLLNSESPNASMPMSVRKFFTPVAM